MGHEKRWIPGPAERRHNGQGIRGSLRQARERVIRGSPSGALPSSRNSLPTPQALQSQPDDREYLPSRKRRQSLPYAKDTSYSLNSFEQQEPTPSLRHQPPMPALHQQYSKHQDTVPEGSLSDRTSAVPQVPFPAALVPRRNRDLRPPPLTRRAGSQYYTQVPNVSPILEELSETPSDSVVGPSHSQANPQSSWYDSDIDAERSHYGTDNEDGEASSYGSMHNEFAGLVRQASLGKKLRPSLTTVKGSDGSVKRMQTDSSEESNNSKSVNTIGTDGTAATFSGDADGNGKPIMKEEVGRRPVIVNSRPSALPSSYGSLDYENERLQVIEPVTRSRSPLASPFDRSARQVASPRLGAGPETLPKMSDRIPTSRRPPRLNIDAVREAEARGSLTSLTELIRRATRLASNLDRGRNTNRQSLLGSFTSEKPEDRYFSDGRPLSGGISDLLTSFPQPSIGTPTSDRSRWPAPFSPSQFEHLPGNDSSSTTKPKWPRRRCCGVSIKGFLLIFLIFVLLITAAIVVPVALIVLPHDHGVSVSSSSLNDCPNSSPCLNDGFSVVSGNSCRCVCVNGFTGDRCATPADTGCVTTDITSDSGDFTNATIGKSIPRLLTSASTNFSVSLDSSMLLSLFSSNNLSCNSENALVTFNGQSSKSKRFHVPHEKSFEPVVLPLVDDMADNVFTSTPTRKSKYLIPRATGTAVATSNGIVYQQSSATPATTVVASETASATPTSSSLTGVSTSSLFQAQTTLDFARIVVLLVFEQSDMLTSAIYVQEMIQAFLLNRPASTSLDMNIGVSNITVNFATFSVDFQNGTTVGGQGNGNGQLKGNTISSRMKRSIS